MLSRIARVFLQALSQHDLVQDDEEINPSRVHVHPTIRGHWTVQFFGTDGVKLAEGTYIGSEQTGAVVLEWASTPVTGYILYGVVHHFDADDTGTLRLRREALVA